MSKEQVAERYLDDYLDGDMPPMFDNDLLSDLVMWAAQDNEETAALVEKTFPAEEGWGEWYQNAWAKEVRNGVCRSSFCIAGQAVVQTGYALIYYAYERVGDFRYLGADFAAPAVPDPEGKVHEKGPLAGKPVMVPDPDEDSHQQIGVIARKELGLMEWEASKLFDGDNEINQIVAIARGIAGRRGFDLNVPDAVLALAGVSTA